ncbi:MAG TPA: non-canonical purine NTP pyrophosphatase [Acidisarcina sp.]|nr:non-canonical purine NTP pyrophosphatase [Acidisarcina sp.]
MPTRIYVASTNPGKLRDFRVAAGDLDRLGTIALLPLPGLATIPAAPEDEDTFEGNARAKAIYYSRLLPGELVLADDSGLEADALHGLPGVRSARFAQDAGVPVETGSVDEANNRLLLREMAGVPTALRSARYRCVLALARDGECLVTGEGAVEGQILTEPRGTGGFGYDPLFFLPSLEKTMAQIDLDTKHQLSHRGRAFRALLGQWKHKIS